jgi:hypothetical protein
MSKLGVAGRKGGTEGQIGGGSRWEGDKRRGRLGEGTEDQGRSIV